MPPKARLSQAGARLRAIEQRKRAAPIASAKEKDLWSSACQIPHCGPNPVGAVVLGQNGHPWMCGMAVLGAATVCYELSALLIIVGIGYLAWQWIASLPVSIAIVVGALIIASAMRR